MNCIFCEVTRAKLMAFKEVMLGASGEEATAKLNANYAYNNPSVDDKIPFYFDAKDKTIYRKNPVPAFEPHKVYTL